MARIHEGASEVYEGTCIGKGSGCIGDREWEHCPIIRAGSRTGGLSQTLETMKERLNEVVMDTITHWDRWKR